MAFTRSQTFGRGSVADSAVAAHMQQVFNYMAGGVALSGVAAWLTLNNMAIMAMAANPITQIIFLAVWLGFGFFMQRILFSLPAAGALGAFAAFSALTGFAFAPMIFMYTSASVVTAFLTAAVMFGGASAYGYFTKQSLSGMGTFLVMGCWGLIGAIVVNLGISLFTGAPVEGLSFVISLISVPLFAAVTAYETNMLKEQFSAYATSEANRASMAIFGAASLYMNFVVLFINLLQLLGQRKE